MITKHQHTIHQRIEKLLSRGCIVESKACGRMGQIMEVFDGDCLIKGPGCKRRVNRSTSFLQGDAVVLVKSKDRWIVKNPDRDWKRAINSLGK